MGPHKYNGLFQNFNNPNTGLILHGYDILMPETQIKIATISQIKITVKIDPKMAVKLKLKLNSKKGRG